MLLYFVNTFVCKKIDEVYVNGSNSDIIEFIPEGVKYLQRLEILDLDTTSMTEVLTCFTNELSADYYVMTHTTAPFISKESIKKEIEVVLSGDNDLTFVEKCMIFMKRWNAI